MKLIEIDALFNMSSGAPCPLVIAKDGHVTVMFFELLFESEIVNDKLFIEESLVKAKFNQVLKHSFGTPNDETLHGHRYYELGLRFYSFYELLDSDWIDELSKIGKVHPRYNPNFYAKKHHYIITFKDSTFECVADSFEIFKYDEPYNEVAQNTLNEFLKII